MFFSEYFFHKVLGIFFPFNKTLFILIYIIFCVQPAYKKFFLRERKLKEYYYTREQMLTRRELLYE